ncbi:hydroxyacylglutathione hydrolase [Aureococcus anophagefferens]|nr:hydroxyacylglutathione hydrolase [Aureococcus anophagefferens]
MRVAIRVGVDLECEIPDGVDAHGEFYVRVNRDRLPPLYSYAPADFDLPATTVWRRDLERLHSLCEAPDAAALPSARALCRKLLNAPLRDTKDHEDRHPLTFSQRRGRESPAPDDGAARCPACRRARREAAAPDADASPRDGDAKRVDWRDELRGGPLANVLAVEGPAPAPPRRALVPCGLCRRACKCPRRAAPEQINVDV